MNTIYIQNFKSPVGELILGSYKNRLVLCDWKHRKMRDTIDKRIQSFIGASYVGGNSEIVNQTRKQLQEYFEEKRKNFEVDYTLIGTDFQKQVWRELTKIPFGKTETYLGLSKRLNNAKAIRAVASANGANAISIIVPCHRIIGSNHQLVGYAGGLSSKKKLLTLENAIQFTNQLDLF